MRMNTHAAAVIDKLGGPTAVAKLFRIRPPSVCKWRTGGIPKARVMYLELARAKELRGFDLAAATSKASRASDEQPRQRNHRPA